MLNFKLIGDNELVVYLNRTSENIRKVIPDALQEVSEHLEEKVKDKFGEYQAGWPKLKRASVIAKYRRRSMKGFNRPKLNSGGSASSGGADDPLVLFGELQKSIRKESNSSEAKVYTDNPYSAVHEYGYAPKGVPSRSYMRLTLMQEEDEVIKIVERKINNIL